MMRRTVVTLLSCSINRVYRREIWSRYRQPYSFSRSPSGGHSPSSREIWSPIIRRSFSGNTPMKSMTCCFTDNIFQRPSFFAALLHSMEGSAAATSRSWERRHLCSVVIKDTSSSSKVSPGLRRFDRASQVLGLRATLLVAISSITGTVAH
jgi:hypothetical protein